MDEGTDRNGEETTWKGLGKQKGKALVNRVIQECLS